MNNERFTAMDGTGRRNIEGTLRGKEKFGNVIGRVCEIQVTGSRQV